MCEILAIYPLNYEETELLIRDVFQNNAPLKILGCRGSRPMQLFDG
jgi:hypothetical protein